VKVLVTGSAGMLGSNLISSINALEDLRGIGVGRRELDLANPEELYDLLATVEPDVVIHAAAKVGGIQANIATPYDFLVSNLLLDTNVVQASIRAGIKNLLYVGSSCMYPKNYRQPLVESDILAAPLEPTNEGYAIAKIAASKLCEYASLSYGLSYRVIIPSNLYGPNDNFNPGSSHLLASVIRKVHNAKINGDREIEVWGAGTARREYTFVRDLSSWAAKAVSGMAQLPAALNLGIGVDHSVDELYLAAMEAIDYKVKLVHNLQMPEGMKAKLMDSSLAREKHGWDPQTDLRTGIEQTYKWFLESKDANARL